MPVQQFRNYSYAADYFRGSWVIAAPSGIAYGDLMIAFCVGDSVNAGIYTLSGWSLVFDTNTQVPGLPAGRIQVWVRVVDYVDVGATYSWDTDHYSFAGGIFAVVNALPQLDAWSFAYVDSNNGVHNGFLKGTPIAPRGSNQLLFWIAGMFVAPGPDVWTPPSVGMYFNNYNGGGSGRTIRAVTAGFGTFPGGVTGVPWTDGQVNNQSAVAGVYMFTFNSNFTPTELSVSALMTEV